MEENKKWTETAELDEVIELLWNGVPASSELRERLSALKSITCIKGISRIEIQRKMQDGFLSNLVKACPCLIGLDLSSTDVSDLNPLSGLSSLTSLYLSGTQVLDLQPLSNLTELNSLYLDDTQVRDLQPLSCLSALTNLDLRDTLVQDLRPLSGMTALKTLDLGNTKVQDLRPLSGLTAVTNLNLRDTQIQDLQPLSTLTSLISLDLRHTQIQDLQPLSTLTALTSLDLRNSQVQDLQPISGLTVLKCLLLSDTEVQDLSPLSGLSTLDTIYLSTTKVDSLEPLSKMRKLNRLTFNCTSVMNLQPLAEIRSLEALSFTDTQIKDLKPLSGLTKLQGLWLDNTEVHDLEPLKDLQKLDLLSARNLHLDRVPDFCIARVSELRLEGTTIAKQPEALFRLPREKIFEAYCFQTKVKINEGKVIFLGESGVGKTHTVLRLEQKGVQKDYKTDSTPGVDIRPYDCGDGTRINFWDFGGQEIMQSMHRCFLTERTCYVVVVSNRDPGTAMPQARKWLRTVAGFSDQVSVLLAVNQWHNASAESEIDPKELRDICPRLTDIIYFSAKNDSPEVFNERITKAILRQVQKLDSIRLELPQSWADIRRELLNMEQNYITLEDYRRVCAKHGLSGNDDNTESIRMWLLDWFNDMGICFSYHKNAPMSARELREYKVLRPAWLTNGIYRILNNGVHLSTSARLSKEDLHDLLNSEQYNSVNKNYKYNTKEERNYILEVMRKFQHSYYCAEEDKEFIPGVLPARKPDHVEPTYLGEPLVYTMKLTYLPASLVHRLMIALWERMDGVQWRFGVRFREGDTVLVVETNEEKVLLSFRLYRRTWEEDDYCELFHEARNRILQDCREMRLVVEKETVSLQKEGSRAEYELNALIDAFESTRGTTDPILMNREGRFRMFTFAELLFPIYNKTIQHCVRILKDEFLLSTDRTKLLEIAERVCPYATLETLKSLPETWKQNVVLDSEFITVIFNKLDDHRNITITGKGLDLIIIALVVLTLEEREFSVWLSKNGTKIEKLQTQENKKKKEPEVGRMRIAGVNRDLLEWAKQSKLYHSAVETADPAWEALEHALDPNETNRFVGSLKLMKAIWAAHPELGLAPDYDLLAALEHSGAFYPNYRDHLTHMFKVFLLGLYLYENHETLREAIQKVWQEKDFLSVWILTALWHDMGYLIENEDGTRNGKYAEKMLDRLKAILSLPLSNLYPEQFTADMENVLQDPDCTPDPLIATTQCTMFNIERRLAAFKGFGDTVKLRRSNADNPIELYYRYTASPRADGRVYFDHGIISACLLLYVKDALCGYLEKAETIELDDKEQTAAIKSFLDSEEHYQVYASAAAMAIALHNLSAPPETQELYQLGVNIKKLCIPMEIEPIAYLLRLCDELQCWDRRRYTPQKEYSFDSDRLFFSRQIRDGANTVVLEIHDEKEKRKVRDALAGFFDPPAETFLGE